MISLRHDKALHMEFLEHGIIKLKETISQLLAKIQHDSSVIVFIQKKAEKCFITFNEDFSTYKVLASVGFSLESFCKTLKPQCYMSPSNWGNTRQHSACIFIECCMLNVAALSKAALCHKIDHIFYLKTTNYQNWSTNIPCFCKVF